MQFRVSSSLVNISRRSAVQSFGQSLASFDQCQLRKNCFLKLGLISLKFNQNLDIKINLQDEIPTEQIILLTNCRDQLT